jgi:hypothetical protein
MRLRSAGETLRAHLPRRLPWEPWSVLVPLVVAQWLVVALVAHRAKHNGWLYYHDGTATWTYTSAWILGRGGIPDGHVGHGLPFLLAPVTWLVGSNFLAALPVLILVQVLVLLPLGGLGIYVLGARSGGRVVGYSSAVIWTLGPIASLHYFIGPNWLNQTLPMSLGLTALGYLPGMLVLLLAAVFVLRALDEQRLLDAATAGVAAGASIAIEPRNAFFLAAPLVAFVAARRARQLGVFAVALTPCLLTYLLWRERGVGQLGTLSQTLLLPPPNQFTWWYNLQIALTELQGSTWSLRFIEWIAVAGFVGLIKRSPVKALFFGAWLGAYVLATGDSRATTVDGVSFWHEWLPAFPAFCVLMASLPLLWPRAGRHVAADEFVYRSRRLVPATVTLAVLLIVALVPLGAVAAAHVYSSRDAVELPLANQFVPVDPTVRPTARAEGRRVILSWHARMLPAKNVFYAVYRTRGANDGLACSNTGGATRCVIVMRRVWTTRQPTFSDLPPKKDVFTYRVLTMANYLNNTSIFSPASISPPVSVRP